MKVIDLAVVCLKQNLLSIDSYCQDVPRFEIDPGKKFQDPAGIQTEDNLDTSQMLLLVSDWYLKCFGFKSSDTYSEGLGFKYPNLLNRFISQSLGATSETHSVVQGKMWSDRLCPFPCVPKCDPTNCVRPSHLRTSFLLPCIVNTNQRQESKPPYSVVGCYIT